jgi:hypothetical protein
MQARLLAPLIGTALLAGAEARADDGPQPGAIVAQALGTVALLSAGVAASVYAAEGRTFHVPWVVTSVLGAGLLVEPSLWWLTRGDAGSVTFGVVLAALIPWPLIWTGISVWSEVDYGEPLHLEVKPETEPKKPTARAPGEQLTQLLAFRF